MKKRLCIIALIITTIPQFASAEFYRYVDKEGNVHFTDDLSNIPVKQRPSVDEYEEAIPPPTLDQSTTDTDATNAPDPSAGTDGEVESDIDSPPEGSAEVPVGQENLSSLYKALQETGKKLEEEYAEISAKRKALAERAKKHLTPSDREALEKQEEELNAQIRDYEARRRAHNETVETYNALVGQQDRAADKIDQRSP